MKKRIRVWADRMGDKRPQHITNLLNGDDYQFGRGIYLHGEMELLNGYDITIFPDNDLPTENGIYDVEVRIGDNMYIDARMYLWYTKYSSREDDDRMESHGLIVRLSDKDYVEHAESKYNELSEFI